MADRKRWPIEVKELGDPDPTNLSDSTTVAERLAMVGQLSKSAFALAGYTEDEMRFRRDRVAVRRLGDPPIE